MASMRTPTTVVIGTQVGTPVDANPAGGEAGAAAALLGGAAALVVLGGPTFTTGTIGTDLCGLLGTRPGVRECPELGVEIEGRGEGELCDTLGVLGFGFGECDVDGCDFVG